jgi:hypothetical protein
MPVDGHEADQHKQQQQYEAPDVSQQCHIVAQFIKLTHACACT